MISRFRDRFGTAGLIVAVLALVAAVAGTALAAGGLTKQQEKQVKKIAKKYAGKQGPAGPAGTPGTNGTNGKDGAAGTNGTPGTAGKSIVTSAAAVPAECPTGTTGTKFEVEGSGSPSHVCSGKNGQPGVEGEPWTPNSELPSGATETGTWSAGPSEGGSVSSNPISFTIKLPADMHFSKGHIILSNGKELNNSFEEVTSTACTGSVASPTAEPDAFCLYVKTELFTAGNPTGKVLISPESGFFNPGVAADGISKAGTIVHLEYFGSAPETYGTWAVTSP